MQESKWLIGNERVKLDIVIFKNGKATVIDIRCPYEKDGNTLAQAEKDKEWKYRNLRMEDQGLDNLGITSMEVVGIAIGSGGTVDHRTVKKLKKLGANAELGTHLQMIALHESTTVWKIHIGEKNRGST